MKALTQIFLVLAFILVVCLVVLQIGIQGNREIYAAAADAEEAALANDENNLNEALARTNVAESELAKVSADVALNDARYNTEVSVVAEWKSSLTQIDKQIDSVLNAQNTVISELAGDTVIAAFKDAQVKLSKRAADLISNRDNLDMRVTDALVRVQEARANQAVAYESFRAKELASFLMQEQLSARQEELARYRYLSPSLQKEVGDNGGAVSNARVSRVISPTSIEMSRGAEQGVELYQYFNLVRQGRVISQLRVTSLSNHSAIAVVDNSAAGNGVVPMVGDTLVRRQFGSAGAIRHTSMGGR
ncbi:MAG: hypothetical protein KDB07_09635 [Planctomycetes bacterium]|nr:hypothetical protein [Planctomycetota bacterium]